MNIKIIAKFKQGFSLLEVAIGLLILGLSLTYFSGIFQLVSETEREKNERVNIYKVQDALNTFLAVNMFLPCPDTDNDGHENRVDTIKCDDREGYLPFKDLGTEGTDAWDNPYYYRVNQQAETSAYIRDVCKSSSVMGRAGSKVLGDLRLCPDSNIYYCSVAGCSSACNATCQSIDPRGTAQTPPYFHLATPPFGALAGSYNLQVYPQSATPYDDSNGFPFGGDGGNGTVAMVVSWGANGDQVYRYNDSRHSAGCDSSATAAEFENCDDDRLFVDTKTGENRDFITWISVNQAKMALIYNGEFR
jgi:prepilin-type N-terminal cleavage/methylation domain-containing protein